MRLIKMLGLAAIAALASMAFLGASSASATFNTALCGEHTSLTCTTPLSEVELNLLPTGQVGKLLSSLAIVLCLGVNIKSKTENGNLGTAPTPLKLKATVTYSNCGTSSTHNNCTITETEEGLFDVLKTGLDTGTASGLAGKAHVVCKNVFGFINFDCEYDASGIEFAIGAHHLTATETAVEKVSGSSICPDESFLDGLVGANPEVHLLQ